MNHASHVAAYYLFLVRYGDDELVNLFRTEWHRYWQMQKTKGTKQ